MVYRPELAEDTHEKLEEAKEILKRREEEDFPDYDTSDIMWRRNNCTFDNDWIIANALEVFIDRWGEE